MFVVLKTVCTKIWIWADSCYYNRV